MTIEVECAQEVAQGAETLATEFEIIAAGKLVGDGKRDLRPVAIGEMISDRPADVPCVAFDPKRT